MKLKEYKGITIEVNADGTFIADIGGVETDTKTLPELEVKIDKYSKSTIHIPIIKLQSKGWPKSIEIIQGRITSIDEDGRTAWFSMENGDRGKASSFYADTEQNKKIAQEIIDKDKQIMNLGKEQQTLYNKLEKVNLTEVIKKISLKAE